MEAMTLRRQQETFDEEKNNAPEALLEDEEGANKTGNH